MEERRHRQRRVLAERRQGERRAQQIPVGMARRVSRERRMDERRSLFDRRKSRG